MNSQDTSDVALRIEELRRRMGDRLLILGHHYQRPQVLRHADVIGDSLELSRHAASAQVAERIVFCGVHFMAESADILTRPDQVVYMPEPGAGCPMADMADESRVKAAWEVLQSHGGGDWLPVVYVNSSAAIKALCGEWRGSACTSGNAVKVFEWVLSQGRKVFFLPDQHLGQNTAHDLGIPGAEVAVFDRRAERGGLGNDALASARVIAWKGHCHVHTAFSAAHVEAARRRWPDARVIVHPEAPIEVVALADAHGSTSRIVDYVRSAPQGSTIVIGTEIHLVERLAVEHAGRVAVKPLAHSMCPNMYKTTEEGLLALLESWPTSHEIHVPPGQAEKARLCLERMLSL